MQFSRATDYGILGLIHLATNEDHAASVSEIAKAGRLSLAFLRKIFQRLKHKGIVKSHRGKGYLLARPARLISVRHILEAVDGPAAMKECLKVDGHCEIQSRCNLTKMWAIVQRRILADLHKIRLADLLE